MTMNISRVFRVYTASNSVSVRAFQKRNAYCCSPAPQHLICFKQWSADMVLAVINSAINLKCLVKKGQGTTPILRGLKIMTLLEVNQPVLTMAISKAATMLGAADVTVSDCVSWDHDYNGKVFSYMCDAMFVSTATHTCLQRFADQAHVPVLCVRSRTHATVQALATVMAVIERFSTMCNVNVAWLGPAHPVLNSYLLLCPMLGANIKFKCCCDKSPVSPLLKKASEELCAHSHTHAIECTKREDVFADANVVIAGPTTTKPDKLKYFKIDVKDIELKPCCNWIFFHTFPRGPEVKDDLFYHPQAHTYNAFENLQFVAGALMAYVIKNHTF